MTAAGALDELVIADFSRVLAGPYAAMLLGDLGAQVVKVEHSAGDDTRAWGPPFDASGALANPIRTSKTPPGYRLPPLPLVRAGSPALLARGVMPT